MRSIVNVLVGFFFVIIGFSLAACEGVPPKPGCYYVRQGDEIIDLCPDAGVRPDSGVIIDSGPVPADGGVIFIDGGVQYVDGGLPPDAAASDSGVVDTGIADTGVSDSGQSDSGSDGGVVDSGQPDSGQTDAATDAGTADSGILDSGVIDAGAITGIPGVRLRFTGQTHRVDGTLRSFRLGFMTFGAQVGNEESAFFAASDPATVSNYRFLPNFTTDALEAVIPDQYIWELPEGSAVSDASRDNLVNEVTCESRYATGDWRAIMPVIRVNSRGTRYVDCGWQQPLR